MVVLAIISTSVFSLAGHGVSLVGVLPKGFPSLTIRHVSLADLRPLFAGAAGIALVSPGRHHLRRVGVRRPRRAGDPRQPGDDRHRRGEPILSMPRSSPVPVPSLTDRMWVGYYQQRWTQVLAASVRLAWLGFGMDWVRTPQGAWLLLRAIQL
jgi:hypothetical protein